MIHAEESQVNNQGWYIATADSRRYVVVLDVLINETKYRVRVGSFMYSRCRRPNETLIKG